LDETTVGEIRERFDKLSEAYRGLNLVESMTQDTFYRMMRGEPMGQKQITTVRQAWFFHGKPETKRNYIENILAEAAGKLSKLAGKNFSVRRFIDEVNKHDAMESLE
jgi:hypothetical protein